MSPVIRISEPVYNRLKEHAKGFVKPSVVIDKLLDFYESNGGDAEFTQEAHTGFKFSLTKAEYNPDRPPDLSHTRIIQAEFDGRSAKSWNNLVKIAFQQARRHIEYFEYLCSIFNVVKGKETANGFHYIPEIDISIRNVEANIAWRNSYDIARKLGCAISVEFVWRNKKGALYPEQIGVLCWNKKMIFR